MYQHIVDSFFCTHSYTAVEWDSLYPVSPKKVVHQTHGDNFVNSQRIFTILESQVNFQQNP